MICPVCGKDALIVEYKNIELDYCPECHGVWCDAGELEMLLEMSGVDNRQIIDELAQPPEAQTKEKQHHCPVCSRKMKKVNMGGNGEIITDVCQRGHGIWFDGGEINHLISSITEKAPEKPEYRDILGFISDMFKYQSDKF